LNSKNLLSAVLGGFVLFCFYLGLNGNTEIQEALAFAYWFISIVIIALMIFMILALPKVNELKERLSTDFVKVWPDRICMVAYACIFAYWGHPLLAVSIAMSVLLGIQMRSLYNQRYDELNRTVKDEPTI